MHLSNKFFKILMLLGLLIIGGCTNIPELQTGSTQTTTQQVELQGASQVDANISVGWGTVNINGGATPYLLDGSFTYNVAEWEPTVTYTTEGSQGVLAVEAPRFSLTESGMPTDAAISQWDLTINETVPLNLNLSLGASNNQLVLGNLNLTNLTINAGAGEDSINLTGPWTSSFTAQVNGGVQPTTIIVPTDVGVLVTINSGIGGSTIDPALIETDNGKYRNAAYGTATTNIELTVNTGVGAITVTTTP